MSLGYVDAFRDAADLVRALTYVRRDSENFDRTATRFDEACVEAIAHFDDVAAAASGQVRGLRVYERSVEHTSSPGISARGYAQPLVTAHVKVDVQRRLTVQSELAAAAQALDNLRASAAATATGFRAVRAAAQPVISWQREVAKRLDALISEAEGIEEANIEAAIDSLDRIEAALAALNKSTRENLRALHYTTNHNRDGGLFLQGYVDLATDVMLVREATGDYADALRDVEAS